MTVATNQEKLSSSVFRSIVRALKADPRLKEVLGDAIRPQTEWYLNGDPHVKGHVSEVMQYQTWLLMILNLVCALSDWTTAREH